MTPYFHPNFSLRATQTTGKQKNRQHPFPPRRPHPFLLGAKESNFRFFSFSFPYFEKESSGYWGFGNDEDIFACEGGKGVVLSRRKLILSFHSKWGFPWWKREEEVTIIGNYPVCTFLCMCASICMRSARSMARQNLTQTGPDRNTSIFYFFLRDRHGNHLLVNYLFSTRLHRATFLVVYFIFYLSLSPLA